MAENLTKTTNVGVSALAREVGLSRAAISKRLKRGESPDEIRRIAGKVRRNSLPVAAAPSEAEAQPQRADKRYRPQGSQLPGEYEQILDHREMWKQLEAAKLRRQTALAERQEIENMARRGELMPIPYVRKWAMKFLVEGRDELLKGPSELADALAEESDPIRCAAIVRVWVDKVMAKFEQMRTIYEPREEEKVA